MWHATRQYVFSKQFFPVPQLQNTGEWAINTGIKIYSVKNTSVSSCPNCRKVSIKRMGEGTGEISKTKNDLSMKLSSQKHVSFASLVCLFLCLVCQVM